MNLVGPENLTASTIDCSNTILYGRSISLYDPLKRLEFSFEKDEDKYNAIVEIFSLRREAFKGLSKVFSDNLFKEEYLKNIGFFNPIDKNGIGYIVDDHNRALFAFNRAVRTDEEDDLKYMVLQIMMGDGGAISRQFNPDSSEQFVKETSIFRDIANLYLHSIYSLCKMKHPKFFYDPVKRVVLTPYFPSKPFVRQ